MLSNGSVLQNRYRVKRLLAQGGMGAVYEAEAIHLGGVSVALKQTLFNENEKSLRIQFQREAEMLARLKHRALPRVSDHFVEDLGQFLVMEFIPGEDLGALLERRKEGFDPPQVMEWAGTLLDALEYIHSQYPPVIHRDIKPQNLKLTPQGELFLIDFGLAKDASTPTRAGKSVHGFTLAYAPPEQIKREGSDARSDLFSLAATLYHLLTHQFPQDARLREKVMQYSIPDPLRPAHQANPNIPLALSAVIARAMALDRERRYNSAAEMHQALRQTRQTIAEEQRRQKEERRLREEARQREIESQRRCAETARLAEQKRQEEERRRRQLARQREIEEQRRQEAARLAELQSKEEEQKLARQREIEERRSREEADRLLAEQPRQPKTPPAPATVPLKPKATPLPTAGSALWRSRRTAVIGATLAVALAGLIGWQMVKNGGNADPNATATPIQVLGYEQQFERGRIRLRFTPREDGYLYLVARDSEGILFPLLTDRLGAPANRARAGDVFVFPAQQDKPLKLTESSAKFTLIFSSRQLAQEVLFSTNEKGDLLPAAERALEDLRAKSKAKRNPQSRDGAITALPGGDLPLVVEIVVYSQPSR